MSEQKQTVEIRIAGHADERWVSWLGASRFEYTDSGETILICTVVDQSQLHGTIRRIRDLGLPLLGISTMSEDR